MFLSGLILTMLLSIFGPTQNIEFIINNNQNIAQKQKDRDDNGTSTPSEALGGGYKALGEKGSDIGLSRTDIRKR